MNEIIKAKPTTYRGIEFRSKSEARLAVALDLARVPYWEYEPTIQETDPGEWKPDFWVRLPVLDWWVDVLVEYKPTSPSRPYVDWWQAQAIKAVGGDLLDESGDYSHSSMCVILCGSWFPNFTGLQIEHSATHPDSPVILRYLVAEKLYESLSFAAKAGSYRFDL